HGRLVGYRFDLGTGAYRGIPIDVNLPTVAAENDRWSSSPSTASTSASRGSRAGTGGSTRSRSRAPPRHTPAPSPGTGGNPHATEIALTHGSVPVRFELARFVIVRDPVIDNDIGIGDAADRPVDIVEHRAIPACKPSEFTGEGPSAIRRWEIHRLGIF